MTVEELVSLAPVVPVVVIEDFEDAVPLAEALVRGGLPAIEVTLRTDNGLGLGRDLFAGMRRNALTAEEGACTWL